MTLENKIKSMGIPTDRETYTITYYEMIGDEFGWSVNTAWNRTAYGFDDLLDCCRGRWEVIKANYGRKRVSGIADISCYDSRWELESDYFPIFAIEPN